MAEAKKYEITIDKTESTHHVSTQPKQYHNRPIRSNAFPCYLVNVDGNSKRAGLCDSNHESTSLLRLNSSI